MSVDLAVRLARPGAPVEAGSRLEGEVELRSDTGSEVQQLKLAVGWRTEGYGNPASGKTQELELLEVPARLQRGERRSLPFRIQAPSGPLSYDGTHLRIVNVLTASADIRWARDPSAELAYELRGVAGQLDGFQGPALNPTAVPAGATHLRPTPKPVEVVLSVLGVLVAVAAAAGAAAADAPVPLVLAIIGGALLLTIAALSRQLRARLAERRLGNVKVVLDRVTVVPGEEIRAALTFEPPSGLRVQRAVATLRAREQVVKGSGKSQSARRHTVVELEAPFCGERTVAAGERVSLWAPLPVAPDAPCSFRARDNRLDWEVEVRIAIAGWPDWVAVQPVMVWPARLAATAGPV